MKKLLLAFLSVMLMLSATGCGADVQSADHHPIPIVDKIYMNNSPLEKSLGFDFLKFYDDGTFQGIDVISGSKSENHYGTYAIEENAITLCISDKSYAGAVVDSGISIEFDNIEFIDWTEHVKDTDPILEKFK